MVNIQEDQDWGIVAMVVDRMFLWVFGAAAVVSLHNHDVDDDNDLNCGAWLKRELSSRWVKVSQKVWSFIWSLITGQ